MRLSSLRELTRARFREFIREPEAVFWTFVFPLLLAGGLAVAFRDKAPEQVGDRRRCRRRDTRRC